MFELKYIKANTPVIPQTPHFTWGEVLQNNLNGYENKDFNVIIEAGVMRNVIIHALMLEEFRLKINKSVPVNSWYRPDLYNDVVLDEHGYKSTKTSDHKCYNSSATDVPLQPTTKIINIWKEICDNHNVSWSIGMYNWGTHLGWRRGKDTRLWDWRK